VHFRVVTFAKAVRHMDGVVSSASACWLVQYGKVIDRRVRELSVESQILPLGTKVAPGGTVSVATAALHPFGALQASELVGYGAIIISGGPESVYDPKAPQLDKEVRTAANSTFRLSGAPCAVLAGKQVRLVRL
jgi:GMP synthase-like glutamine amidotransferase